MKRLMIAAVGLALVVGVTGCRSSGYSEAEVEGTVSAVYTAIARVATPTPVPLLTHQDVRELVSRFILDRCVKAFDPPPAQTVEEILQGIQKPRQGYDSHVCANEAVGAESYDDEGAVDQLYNACDATYRSEQGRWVFRCPQEFRQGGHVTYIVDDSTGTVYAASGGPWEWGRETE